MKEMLEVGAVCPRQSLWCNANLLVRKEYESLQFCLDFCKLNARTKKDSYPTPTDTRSHQEFSWHKILLLLGFEGWCLADSNGQSFKAVHCFHHGELRVL